MALNHFVVWDYLVVAGTLIFSLLIGLHYALRSKQTKEDYLVGSRESNVFAISVSLYVTFLSAITILGYPSEIYAHGLQIFLMTILFSVFMPFSIYLFVSVFYKMRLTSVFEYLELRFESPLVRRLMAFIYIFENLVATSIVLYAPSLALETMLGMPFWMSIVGVGVCGTIYTSIGGFKAVIFTDVFQFFMILFGMVGIIVKGFVSAGGILEAFQIANNHGRLTLIDWTVDPFMRHNTLNFLLGTGCSSIIFYGTVQAHVQRYNSLPTFRQAVNSMILSAVINILTVTLVVCTGVAIIVTFIRCDPVRLGHISKVDQIIPYFVVTQLSFIPGIMGLFVSCVFSAVLSSVSSSLNCMSTVTWEDFLSQIPVFKNLSAKGQTNVSRFTGLVYGGLCTGLAFGAQKVGTMVFQAAMSAWGVFTGPMGAVFILSLFVPFANKWGTAGGLLVGLSSMTFVTVKSFFVVQPADAPLPTFIDDCSPGTNMSLATILTHKVNSTVDTHIVSEIEWPDKFYTMSYILYPFVGAVISFTCGLILSLLTGGWSESAKVNPKYLHPLLQKCRCSRGGRTVKPEAGLDLDIYSKNRTD